MDRGMGMKGMDNRGVSLVINPGFPLVGVVRVRACI